MDLDNHVLRLIRLNDLIRRKGTGSTEELANTLGISIRSCQRLTRTLKNLGAPIEFSKGRNSFVYYKENGRFVICEWIEEYPDVKNTTNGKHTHSNS